MTVAFLAACQVYMGCFCNPPLRVAVRQLDPLHPNRCAHRESQNAAGTPQLPTLPGLHPGYLHDHQKT